MVLIPKPSQNAGFGAWASGKHRKTRGFIDFAALKQRVWKGHRAETIVKTTCFAYRIGFPSRLLTISGPPEKTRQNAIHSSISTEKHAKTRVLARWPQENIVKRVVYGFPPRLLTISVAKDEHGQNPVPAVLVALGLKSA